MYQFIRIGFGLISLLSAVPSIAHHGNAPHFDGSIEINVTGVITRFAFTNPHSYVYFEVIDENGAAAEWRCESSAATLMQRNGWNENTLLPGQTIEVTGNPGRREDNLCYARQMVVDGQEFSADATPPTTGGTVVVELVDTESEHPLFLNNGQPNISGNWINAARVGTLGKVLSGGVPVEGNRRGALKPMLTTAGQAASDAYDDRFDNPSMICEPTNILWNWGHGWEENQIRQTNDAIFISAGYMDMERTIHLNMTEHPNNIVPSITGHSIGKWEGDTLMVDTIGLTGRVLSGPWGALYSDQAHIIEQIKYVPETRSLIRDWTIEDPLYFQVPFSGQNQQDIAAQPYKPYGCVDLGGANNIRPENLE